MVVVDIVVGGRLVLLLVVRLRLLLFTVAVSVVSFVTTRCSSQTCSLTITRLRLEQQLVRMWACWARSNSFSCCYNCPINPRLCNAAAYICNSCTVCGPRCLGPPCYFFSFGRYLSSIR
jgi:hypothetical protein